MFRTWIGLALGLAFSCFVTNQAKAAAPWDTPFSKDTKAILTTAQSVPVPDDAQVSILLEEHFYTIDARRLTTKSIRRVYRVLKQDALVVWASAYQAYEPWYEHRPELKARVISNTGDVRTLDPATIADTPASEFDASLFTDRRIVKAPLPAVSVGSIVEVETVVRQKQPLLAAGHVYRVSIMDFTPTERFHLKVEADRSIPLKVASKGIPEGSLKQEQGKRGQVIECERLAIRPPKDREYSLPFDTALYPYIAFSTGESWQKVAEGYHRIVENALASGWRPDWLDALDAGASTQSILETLTERLHKEIRYTGVEFGDAAIVPRSPAETLERGYGDCKDKSTLLVAALRAAGLKAHVALLSAGHDTDVHPDLPGFGLFNHAIVYVDTHPPVWIDATAQGMRVGAIPPADQGRFALIAHPESTGLISIPETLSSENWRRHTVDVRMADYGLGSIEERIEAAGVQEAALRESFGGNETDGSLQKKLEEQAKLQYAGKLASVELEGQAQPTKPFRVRVRVDGSASAVTGLDDASSIVQTAAVFAELPYTLLMEPDDEEPPRQSDFMLTDAHQVEYVFRIHLPKHYKPGVLPDLVDARFGEGAYTRSFTMTPDGVLEVRSRLDTGKRRMTAGEFRAFRETVQKYGDDTENILTFVPEMNELLALGNTSDALALAQGLVNDEPDNAIAYVRRARVLLALGLGIPARHDARKATEINPTLPVAWVAQGLALQSSSFGKEYSGDWDREEAEKAYRKAVELDPEDQIARMLLAALLEYDSRGFRYGDVEQLQEAIVLYRTVVEDRTHPAAEQNLALALFHAGQLEAALEQAKKCPPDTRLLVELTVAGAMKGANVVLTDPRLASVDARPKALTFHRVAMSLMNTGRYKDAAALVAGAARLMNMQDLHFLSTRIGSMRPYSEAMAPPTDPRFPAQQLAIHTVLGTATEEQTGPLFSQKLSQNSKLRKLSQNTDWEAMERSPLLAMDPSNHLVLDFTVSEKPRMKGDDTHGYQVPPLFPGHPTFFTVMEEGSYRILGSSGETLGIGEHILSLLDAKDVAGAQWWLDTLISSLKPVDGSTFPAMQALWSGVGEARRGPAAIRLAAASLMTAYTDSPKGLEILKVARAGAKAAYDRDMLDLAIGEALLAARKWEELLPVAERLAGTRHYSQRGLTFGEQAATETGKWAELESIAARLLLESKDDRKAMGVIALARARMKDIPNALEWIRKMDSEEDWEWDAVVLESWIALDAKLDSVKFLERLESNEQSRRMGASLPAVQFTLAMLQAAHGREGEAILSMGRAMKLESLPQPSMMAWAVYAEICNRLGLPVAAQEALQRSSVSLRHGRYSLWAFDLVSRSISPSQK